MQAEQTLELAKPQSCVRFVDWERELWIESRASEEQALLEMIPPGFVAEFWQFDVAPESVPAIIQMFEQIEAERAMLRKEECHVG